MGFGTLVQTGGTIEADSGSTVAISSNTSSAAVNGGTINLGAGGTVSLENVGFSNGVVQGLGGTLAVFSGESNTTFSGSLTLIGIGTFTGGANQGTINASGGTISIGGNGTSTFSNMGVIVVGSLYSNNGRIQGGGTLLLAGPASFINAGSLVTNNTIVGQGSISLGNFVNSSAIIASGGSLLVASTTLQNSGLLRADGGTLALNVSSAINNTGQVIDAVDGGVVTIFAPGVTGGSLSGTSGNIVIQGASAQLQNVALNGSIICNLTTNQYQSSGSLTLSGLIPVGGTVSFSSPVTSLNTSNCTVSFSDTGAWLISNSTLTLHSDLNMVGGNLLLQNGVISTPGNPQAGDPVVHLTMSGNLTGSGSIGYQLGEQLNPSFGALNLLNTGTISAVGGLLTVLTTAFATSQPSLTNTGLMQAEDGGTLVLNGGFIDNTDGLIQANCGSVVYVGAVSGGTLTATGGGTLALQLASVPQVTLSGNVFVGGGLLTSVVDIPQNLTALPVFLLIPSGTATLTGGGTLTLPGASSITLASYNTVFTCQNPIFIDHGSLDVTPYGTLVLGAPLILDDGVVQLSNFVAQTGLIEGTGTLTETVSQHLTDGVRVSSWFLAGNVVIRAGDGDSGTSVLGSLKVAASPSEQFTGRLDITDNVLILEAADPTDKASKIAYLQSAIQSGYNGTAGAWTGTGITSSTVAADAAAGTKYTLFHTTVGIFDNGAFPAGTAFTSFGGQPVDAGSIIVVRALVGDANLDGTVDNTDLVALLTHFGESGQTQATGDYNGDGTVNNTDLVALLTDYGQSLPGGMLLAAGGGGADAAADSAAPAAVPEAGTLAVLLAAAPGLLRRRRGGRKLLRRPVATGG